MDHGRGSLKDFIVNLYGEETFKKTRRLEALRKKKVRLLTTLIFLIRCRDNNIIPKFLKSRRMFNSQQAQRIYLRLEKDLLRERIHTTRKDLAHNEKSLFKLHLELGNRLCKYDWENIDRLSYNIAEKERQICQERQTRKFTKLQRAKNINAQSSNNNYMHNSNNNHHSYNIYPSNNNKHYQLDSNKTVVNLTDHELTPGEKSLLEKGGNFAITPKDIPMEDIITNIEVAIRPLKPEEAQTIRNEAACILMRSKELKSNLSNAEKKAIRTLNEDTNIVILPADKGNATVLLRKADYESKIIELLDPVTYNKVNYNPTTRVLKSINQLIKDSALPVETKRLLFRSEAVTPRLYGLPKIHKKEVPLRPIVDAIGAPAYYLAKHLAVLLQQHVNKTDTFIKNSAHFVEKIRNIILSPGDILVSFDVVSLFTKVPVNDTLEEINKIFSTDITKLFEACLTKCFFQWNNEFYVQKDGVAMGSPLSPVIANFFMEKFEQRALNTALDKPAIWFRYVDDTFVIWQHGEEKLNNFLIFLNKIHPSITFTMETETNGVLPFLDVRVSRRPDLTLGHSVYRKPTHTDRYLNRMSNHHPKQLRGVLKTLVERARTICEPGSLKEELQHLNNIFQANGFKENETRVVTRLHKIEKRSKPEENYISKAYLPYIKQTTDRIGKLLGQFNIKTIFKPTSKIQQALRSAKDKRDPLSSAGVYRIPCSCGGVYIGMTKRSVKTRIVEHKRSCKLGQIDKSAVAEHVFAQDGHDIRFEETKVLSSDSLYFQRLYREAIEIQKHRNNFNRKEETLRVPHSWLPILENRTVMAIDVPPPQILGAEAPATGNPQTSQLTSSRITTNEQLPDNVGEQRQDHDTLAGQLEGATLPTTTTKVCPAIRSFATLRRSKRLKAQKKHPTEGRETLAHF